MVARIMIKVEALFPKDKAQVYANCVKYLSLYEPLYENSESFESDKFSNSHIV